MKIGLVGYQGSGKSTVFELLTSVSPDSAKVHSGQVGTATLPDERYNQLVDHFQPKKCVPAKIELFDTPGLSRTEPQANAQRLAVIREAAALVHVIGAFSEGDPSADVSRFNDDVILADLQVVDSRIDRLKKDITKPRPDRDELKAELEAIEPIAQRLSEGKTLLDFDFNEAQEKAAKAFSLLSRKKRLLLLNTSSSDDETETVRVLEESGCRVVQAPCGLELEVQALPADERDEFAAAMGLREPCRTRLLQAIFEVTDQITFFTCNEKEVHAWLLRRGDTAIDAADTIHSDLARGFIRAEIVPVDDLLRLGSEREVKAAGLHHVEGKDYVMQHGDEIVVRFSV